MNSGRVVKLQVVDSEAMVGFAENLKTNLATYAEARGMYVALSGTGRLASDNTVKFLRYKEWCPIGYLKKVNGSSKHLLATREMPCGYTCSPLIDDIWDEMVEACAQVGLTLERER
jgi:hypothetical protein